MARVIYGGAQRGGAGMGEDFSTARAARRQRSSPERGVPAPKGRCNLRYLAQKDQEAEEVLTGLGNEDRTGAAGLAVSSGGEGGAVLVDGSQACSSGRPGLAGRRASVL